MDSLEDLDLDAVAAVRERQHQLWSQGGPSHTMDPCGADEAST